MARKRAVVRLQGRVQGVGFRSFVEQNARREGIKGWVKNLPDGDVKAVFEGEKAALDRILETCRQGPRGGVVVNMDIIWEDFRDEFGSFEVRF